MRSIVMMTAGVVLMGLGGCQWNSKGTPVMSGVSAQPLLIDRAMEIRNAEPQTAWYASGSALAGGTGFLFEPSDNVPPDLRRVTDVSVAGLNDLCLPVGLFVNSPTKRTIFHGEWVPPSYNAMPPLPAGEQMWEPGMIAPKSAPVAEAPMTAQEPAPSEQAAPAEKPAPVVQPSSAPPATQEYPQ